MKGHNRASQCGAPAFGYLEYRTNHPRLYQYSHAPRHLSTQLCRCFRAVRAELSSQSYPDTCHVCALLSSPQVCEARGSIFPCDFILPSAPAGLKSCYTPLIKVAAHCTSLSTCPDSNSGQKKPVKLRENEESHAFPGHHRPTRIRSGGSRYVRISSLDQIDVNRFQSEQRGKIQPRRSKQRTMVPHSLQSLDVQQQPLWNSFHRPR